MNGWSYLFRLLIAISVALLGLAFLIGGNFDRGVLLLILSYVISIEAELGRVPKGKP